MPKYGPKAPASKISSEELRNYIRRNPGLTGWQLAKRLGLNSAGLSSRLKRLSDDCFISRKMTTMESGREAWTYYA